MREVDEDEEEEDEEEEEDIESGWCSGGGTSEQRNAWIVLDGTEHHIVMSVPED